MTKQKGSKKDTKPNSVRKYVAEYKKDLDEGYSNLVIVPGGKQENEIAAQLTQVRIRTEGVRAEVMEKGEAATMAMDGMVGKRMNLKEMPTKLDKLQSKSIGKRKHGVKVGDKPRKKLRKIAKLLYMSEDFGELRGHVENVLYRVPYKDVQKNGLSLVDVDLSDFGGDMQAVRAETIISHHELMRSYPALTEDLINGIFGKYKGNLESLNDLGNRRVIGSNVKGVFPFDEQGYLKIMSEPWMSEFMKDNEDKTKAGKGDAVIQGFSENGRVIARALYGGIKYEVDFGSLEHIRPSAYLNDALVDFGVATTLSELGLDSTRICLLSGLSMQTMMARSMEELLPDQSARSLYRSVARHNPDILQIKYIVFPVVREQHWFLAIICNPFPDPRDVEDFDKKIAEAKAQSEPFDCYVHRLYKNWIESNPCVMIMDSLRNKISSRVVNYYDFVMDTSSYIKRAIIAIHDKHWQATDRTDYLDHGKVTELIKLYQVNCAQQPNEHDCGIYVMTYVNQFFHQLAFCNYDFMELANVDFAKHVDPNKICHMRQLMEFLILQSCQQVNPELVQEVYNTLKLGRTVELKCKSKK